MNPANFSRLRGPGRLRCVRTARCALAMAVIVTGAAANAAELAGAGPATILEVRKLWDAAPHNAFTDLTRFGGRFVCVFREGSGHVSPDGAVRVLVSPDGRDRTSVARLTLAGADLRDPKVVVTPSGQLMLTAAAARRQPDKTTHQTLAWFAATPAHWGEPVTIGETNFWLWRVTWQGDTCYGVGYDTLGEHSVRLYRSNDGRHFDTLVPDLFDRERPNETSLVFLSDATGLCLLRRDGDPGHGLLGRARPPYTEWTWQDMGARIGGPHLLALPDGRLVAAVRLYNGQVRTSLVWIEPTTGQLTELLKLPSGGDTSYAGLAWYEATLWVSYYSSREGRTAIYLARVKLPPAG